MRGRDGVDFKGCSVVTIFKKELNFPNHLFFLCWKFIHSSVYTGIDHLLSNRWKEAALVLKSPFYKRKTILTMTFLLSCQGHPRAFKHVIARLSAYPLRLFSAVRKEYAVSLSSYLTLYHSEVENTWREMAGPNWPL